jgi:hypothetical protein
MLAASPQQKQKPLPQGGGFCWAHQTRHVIGKMPETSSENALTKNFKAASPWFHNV